MANPQEHDEDLLQKIRSLPADKLDEQDRAALSRTLKTILGD